MVYAVSVPIMPNCQLATAPVPVSAELLNLIWRLIKINDDNNDNVIVLNIFVCALQVCMLMTGVRFPSGGRDFSLFHTVQTGPGANLAFYPTNTWGCFSGGKATGT
jgi:hypothetical protein